MQVRRHRVAFAFLGSVLVHAILLFAFALIVSSRHEEPPPAPLPDDPLQVEVAEETPPPPTPPPLLAEATPTPTPRVQRVVEATGEDTNETPPPGSALSDRTTLASSTNETEQDRKGPAQTGQRMAAFQFDPQPPATGVLEHVNPPPQTEPEIPKPNRAAARNTPAPASPAPAAPTPEPAPVRPEKEDEFAMIMATPPPPPEDPFDPSIRSTSPPLPKPATRPTPKPTPAPRAGAARSELTGGATVRGPGGVDTIGSPMARYTQQVANMIKFVWNRNDDTRETGGSYGTVIIHFTIDRNGLVISPRVTSNTADSVFAAIAYQAVVVARLPPMPDDVVADLNGTRLQLDLTFERTPPPP